MAVDYWSKTMLYPWHWVTQMHVEPLEMRVCLELKFAALPIVSHSKCSCLLHLPKGWWLPGLLTYHLLTSFWPVTRQTLSVKQVHFLSLRILYETITTFVCWVTFSAFWLRGVLHDRQWFQEIVRHIVSTSPTSLFVIHWAHIDLRLLNSQGYHCSYCAGCLMVLVS